ncbi:MAG TPA: CoA pyrophosphatase [Thermoplasmata archaeon]|nr:CoA pyrophosphatase [Thermoplasmata archaeon]
MRPETGEDPFPSSRSAAELLERHPILHPPVSTAGAAVTIVLRDGAHGPETLLIERATNASDPASGDVALPGGRVEDRDGSLATTALRELREEVGLGAGDLAGPLRFVGATPAPRFRLHVGVFAARLGDAAGPPTVGSPTEVAHVFWLPLRSLAESRFVTRNGPTGPRPVRATVHEGHVLWGFTRRVLREFTDLPPEDRPEGPVTVSTHGDPRGGSDRL